VGSTILIGTFVLLVMLGVPIAFALGMSSLVTMLYLGIPVLVVVQKMADGMDNYSLMAIPFFILSGAIISEGGMANKLIDFASIIVGRIRGGLAMVNVLASMLFGSLSGSAVASSSSIGSILIPSMVRKGYSRDFSVGLTMTAATQGIIIPPSHNSIIYALAAGGSVSIAELYLAGIVPGVLIGLALMAVAFVLSVKRGYPKEEKVSTRQALRITRDAIWGLFTGVIILGGILSGIFTAVESSAVAVVYAFLVTFFVYREIPLREFPRIVVQATKTIAIVMILIGTSSAFGWLIAYLRIPDAIMNGLNGISTNRYVVLLMINVMLLFLGMIMDMAPLIVITTPILLPVVINLGFSPVQFGIMMLLNLSIGLCTPPVGAALFVGCAVGRIRIEEVMKSIWPFYGAMAAVLLLVAYVPPVTLWMTRFVK